ncbi:hypothetical protein FDP41_005221 [Naegleria fowleri]|uniref:SAP domain-containing protein n=1 Tax=Naegleria fowleri TaxID=5763 RepID=A0A6A5BP73_NAEFO|nr:uncharacterized protein FDP41_005221 [Naegleria fowleri]KAF0975894.1 hypothetical protein FDP41_005221 [Naegleria fowleri]CAG4716510.1 unnamed protein product [Naegleria fowleri]
MWQQDAEDEGDFAYSRDDPLLGNIDDALTSHNDEDDNESEYKHLKDSIIFLIDAQSSMFDPLPLSSQQEVSKFSSNLHGSTRLILEPSSSQSSSSSSTITTNHNHNENSSKTGDPSKLVDSIPFFMTLKAVANTLSDKIISNPSDVLGVVFYNTKEKLNQFDFNHIYVYHDLDTPDAKRIKDIENLIESKSKASNHPSIVNSCLESPPPTNTVHEALWTCQHLFSLSHSSSQLGFKRIFLFTNDDHPCRDDHSARIKSIERSRDLINSDITIDLFVLKSPPQSFKSELFWREMIHIDDDEYTGNITYDCAVAFKDLRDKLRRREFKKRGITSIPFIIGETSFNASNSSSGGNSSSSSNRFSNVSSNEQDPSYMVYHCTLYSCVSKARKPPTILLHSDTNKPLKCETKYICEDTGVELMKQGSSSSGGGGTASTTTTTGELMEGSNFQNDMIYYYEYGNQKAEFTLDELSQIRQLHTGSSSGHFTTTGNIFSTTTSSTTTNNNNNNNLSTTTLTTPPPLKNEFTQPGLKLLGFKPKSRLKVYHNYKSSGFLYPNDHKIQGSLLALSALHKKMIEMDKIAICRFIQREGIMPQYVALVAQEEVFDEQDHSQIIPPGFQIIFLPYADGIRKPQQFEIQSKPSDKHVQLAKKLAKKMQINFNSSFFNNPSLQQFYQSLQALALEHSEVEQIEDTLKPDIEGMKKYQSLMDEFKEITFPQNYQPIASNTKNTSKGGGGGGKSGTKGDGGDGGDGGNTTGRSKSLVAKEEDDDHTTAKDGGSSSRVGHHDEVKTENSKSSKKRKNNEEEQVKPKEKKKKKEISSDDEESEEIDMVQLIKDGKAEKLTLDILKEFCKQYKLKVSGSKKDLIQRITDFLRQKKKI